MTKNDIARVCHDVIKSFSEAFGDTDYPSWEAAPVWMHSRSIELVDRVEKNPDRTPGEEHAMWMTEKLENGWVYAETTDRPNKKHALLVPFGRLPEKDQARNNILLQVAKSLLPFLNERVAATPSPIAETAQV